MEESSFGIIPFRKGKQGIEFLLVRQRGSFGVENDQGHWGFPKGHAEKNETPVEAALRECAEETGISSLAIIEGKKFVECYVFMRGKTLTSKTVTYFLGRVVKGRVSVQRKEIEHYRWAAYLEAKELLTFPEAREVLRQAYEYLRK